MFRTLLCCATLAVVPLAARADAIVTPTEMLIQLTVQPMAAPRPALRYLLLPEIREMNPGNPIPNYLKSLMDPAVSAADRETIGRASLLQVDQAARLDKPDWQILLKLKTDGIGLLLPDVQKIRSLAAALQMRFREEIAQRRFDDANRTAKTLFAMSRHMSEHPTLIGDLVGIAIAMIAIGPVEEMLQQPGCPNYYWALTNLPNPLISLDKGMEGERVLLLSEFRELSDTTPMTADQIKKLVAHIDKVRDLARSTGNKEKTTREWLSARTKDERTVRAARGRLIEYGLSEERLQRFPADQIILLDEKREFEVRRDEVMKLIPLPIGQFLALLAKTKTPKEPALFGDLVPALHKVRQAQGRLEQRIAMLRHVEALRIYAAEHDGKLPATLADVTVPLPADPFTGKPFRYSVDGTTAHVRGTPPPGEEKNPSLNVHYEVTIRK